MLLSFFRKCTMVCLLVGCSTSLTGQSNSSLRFFEPADTFHHQRFYSLAIGGAVVYTGVLIGLNEVWYKEYERSSFHLFNDVGEWNDVDKAGHAMTAYFESNWVFAGARWTGLTRRKSMWTAVALGSLFQATIETFDGFSEKWGFSLADMAYNTAGVSLFAAQEMAWQDQRIRLKVSSFPQDYPDRTVYSIDGERSTTLDQRARDLYGGGYPATFFKDYNAMTIWASVNPASFFPKKERGGFPSWLNIAVGYGAQNMYGGFENKWSEEGHEFVLGDLPVRYRQYYLSLDVDLSRIRTRSRFLRSLLGMVNVFKIPAPALELNSQGNFRFHPLHF